MFWSGPRSGSVLQNELPLPDAQPAPVKPQVVPVSMLCPPSTTPLPHPPARGLARMVLATTTCPEPPTPIVPLAGAAFPLKVQFVTGRGSLPM